MPFAEVGPGPLEYGWPRRNVFHQPDLEQTLRAYTEGGARAGFMEDVVGDLTPGKYADLVVLSGNVFEMAEEDIVRARVDMTVVEGEIVYDVGGGAQ